jgi:hypothetical protein
MEYNLKNKKVDGTNYLARAFLLACYLSRPIDCLGISLAEKENRQPMISYLVNVNQRTFLLCLGLNLLLVAIYCLTLPQRFGMLLD